ncbi:N-methyl-L-tryptophan oxidase [Bacillus sp. FJAT-27251]|uniref:N-methyl-L-tryptophan oxidase n=1 Tax=Bacillus sp. FJAT-27251 TaxID=1684142 RepID=UPI0006A78067|nr:N-methyl-L-tryptophan oxidase [Bacillus sp. FJAT-27251]
MHYDVIIIGAGSMGMAAGYYLSKSGKKVLLLDSHNPPHSEGAHHGETRIIRHAYGEGEEYVAMALRAQELWLELQELTDKKLFLQTGVLNVGAPDSAFIHNILKSAESHSLQVEKLGSSEINHIWAGFSVPDGMIGCYENKSGVLFSEACIEVYRQLAIENGAHLKVNTTVEGVAAEGDRVHVETEVENYTSDSLIVTAGKGTPKLLPGLGIELPLQPVRKTFSWFECDEGLYHSSHFPAFAFELQDKLFYGFPSIERAGIKIGRHDGGQPLTQEEGLAEFGSYSEDKDDVSGFAAKYFSGDLDHRIGKTCTYTNTPDEDFIIDQHPNFQNIYLACGFSGHGFKFSSVVGEILCQLITEGRTELDLNPFTMKRFS